MPSEYETRRIDKEWLGKLLMLRDSVEDLEKLIMEQTSKMHPDDVAVVEKHMEKIKAKKQYSP